MKLALVLAIVFLSAACLAGAQTLDSLDAALTKVDQERGSMLQEYDREKKQNEERQKRIESGTATDADMKLAYASAARLDSMNARLNEWNTQKQQLCAQWRLLYRSTVDRLLAGAEKETDKKKKAGTGRELQRLQARNAQLCAENFASGSLEWKNLQVETYDGPQEINQKTQLLKDIEREMTLRLARLDDLYEQTQKERRTRERAQEFIQEGTLFDQVVSIRAPGNSPVDSGTPLNTGAATGGRPGPDAVTHSESAEVRNPNDEMQFSDNPKKAEEDYRKKREEMLQQQGELEKKIRLFEEKASALLHP